MENIEQLQQENAKLQERLNNAAKFFREQKAQIESLTKENDELKHDAESFNSLQENYENTIKSKDKDYEVLQNTYNEVFEENKQLKEQISSYENTKENDSSVLEFLQDQVDEYEAQLKKYEKEKKEFEEKLEARINQIRAVENTTNEEVKKVTIARDEWITKYREQEKKLNESLDKIKSLETINDELNKDLDEYKSKLKTSDSLLNELTDKLDKVENTLLNTKKSVNEYIEENEKLKISKSDLEMNINDLTSQLSEVLNNKTKYQEFTEMIIGLVDSFNNNGNNIDNSVNINDKNKKNNINSTGNQFMADAIGMNI